MATTNSARKILKSLLSNTPSCDSASSVEVRTATSESNSVSDASDVRGVIAMDGANMKLELLALGQIIASMASEMIPAISSMLPSIDQRLYLSFDWRSKFILKQNRCKNNDYIVYISSFNLILIPIVLG